MEKETVKIVKFIGEKSQISESVIFFLYFVDKPLCTNSTSPVARPSVQLGP
jgi:hypothetical protein